MLSQLAVTFIGQSVKAGKGLLVPSLLSTAVIGSVIGVNFVGKTNTSSFIAVNKAILTPAYAKDRNTGGLTTYDLIRLASPYAAGAAANGLRVGTGVVKYAQLDIITNPKGVQVDCTRVGAINTATGAGVALFNNISATGSTNIYSTPFTLGPTQYIKCSTLTVPTAFSGSLVVGSFSGSLRLEMTDSDVIN